MEASDLFIGLIGMRRGWEPPDDNQDRHSITEMEYDWAKDIAPRFMYVTRGPIPCPGNPLKLVEIHSRHRAFRARVMSDLTVSQEGFVSEKGIVEQYQPNQEQGRRTNC